MKRETTREKGLEKAIWEKKKEKPGGLRNIRSCDKFLLAYLSRKTCGYNNIG